MQTVCTSLQTDNHVSTSSLSFAGQMLFLPPIQHKTLKTENTDRTIVLTNFLTSNITVKPARAKINNLLTKLLAY